MATPAVLAFTPKWLQPVRDANADFTQQAAMLHLTYTGVAVHATLPAWTSGVAPSWRLAIYPVSLSRMYICLSDSYCKALSDWIGYDSL